MSKENAKKFYEKFIGSEALQNELKQQKLSSAEEVASYAKSM